MKHIVSVIVALLVVLLLVASIATAQVPNQMQYQGYLTDDGGSPLDTTVSMVFTIYDDSVGAGVIWSETHPSVTVENGLFEVVLGSVIGVSSDVVDDSVRWLGITVGGDSEIHPRTKLVTVPYAFRVSTVDGASGGIISGDVHIQSDLTVSGKATIGPNHTNTGGYAFVAGENNEASGYQSTVGGGGWNTASEIAATVGGGQYNTADTTSATVGGGFWNAASGPGATVAGGIGNTASGMDATVGGGYKNLVQGDYSAILGGYADTITATADYSYLFGIGTKLSQDSAFMVDLPHIRFGDETDGYEFPTGDGTTGQVMQTDGSGHLSWVEMSGGGGGGWYDDGTVVRLETDTDSVGIGTTTPTEKLDVDGNIKASGTITSGSSITIDGVNDKITATTGTIDFDDENLVTTGKATIGPGNTNTGTNAFVAGQNNTASANSATISGGVGNTASSGSATIGGGQVNIASGGGATVGGGSANTASEFHATVSGGVQNFARGEYSVVAGGGGILWADSNSALGDWSAIGGGHGNIASDTGAIIAGGGYNKVAGKYSGILGGHADTITSTADYSYLFGIGSKLTEDSTFMVDMPHIRFGDEIDGYEFPVDDGTAGQVIQSDGSGQLTWADMSGGGAGNWSVTDSVLYTNNYLGIARGGAGNVLYGDSAHTMVNLGVACTTGASGHNYYYATVGGGGYNAATYEWATVGGGYRNQAHGEYSTIAGGRGNWADTAYGAVGGGYANRATRFGSTVAGGIHNTASEHYSFCGGGYNNKATNLNATVGGGDQNEAGGEDATVGGGRLNNATGEGSTIAGGVVNLADAIDATVGGGTSNSATGFRATVPGGYSNNASGQYSFCAGLHNTVSGNRSAICGGSYNTIESSAHFSYLFGINSTLTEDSTFMVDMPHIRFGDETDGYEFPASDGSAGKFLATDGSGQLGWVEAGLSLPYSGSATSSGTVFNITNYGTGTAIKGRSEGNYGTGVDAYALGDSSYGLYAYGGGYRSYGVYAYTDQEASQGVRCEVLGDNSYGMYVDASGAGSYGISVDATGQDGIGLLCGGDSVAAKFYGDVDVWGRVFTEVLEITGGSDLAEPFSISGSQTVPPGALVVIDDKNPGQLKLSHRAYDTRVAGVVSGAGGVNPGLTLSQHDVLEGGQHVALSGQVFALGDASYGAIKPGDMLTTSDTPGHAMKAAERERAYGAVIGKAMTGLKEGKGLVLVLVNLQ